MQIQGVMVRPEHPRPLTAGRSCEGIDERDKSAQFPDEPINHDMRVLLPPRSSVTGEERGTNKSSPGSVGRAFHVSEMRPCGL